MAITLSPVYTQRESRWTNWKSILIIKKFAHQYDDDGIIYTIWGYDIPEVHICTIWKGEVPQAVIDAGYSQSQNDTDKANFETSFKPFGNAAINIKSKDQYPVVYVKKSFSDSSRSFVTPDYSKKESWFYDVTFITDETATTADNINYDFAPGATVVNLKYVTDRTDWSSRKVTVKKNGTVITTGFSITHNTNNKSTIVFGTPNAPEDIIIVSYSTPNSSKYELIASAGKCIKINYVESQFSAGSILNDTMRYALILNNPNTGNQDYMAGYTDYQTASDYYNKANLGVVNPPFGELTKDVLVFPWEYQTGIVLKPIGDATTDPTKNEFNKLKIYLLNDLLVTNCEIATGTMYCLIESL